MRESEPSRAFAFPGGTLAAGGRVVVLADGSNGASDGAYHAPFRLSSAGETILLLDAAGNTLDRLEIPALGENQVYCRDDSGAWQRSAAPTPGEPNRVESASEIAKTTTVMSGALEITEVMTRNVTYCPDAQGRAHDWVELHNASNAPVSLSGWSLSDDAQKRGKWTFPDATIPAGGYLIVYCSGTSGDASELHASFRLSGEGTQVILTCADGQTASMADVPALEKDQSWSKQGGGWTKALSPTPGQSNDFSGAVAIDVALRANSAANVILSEIAASSSTVGTDWIELYNAGTEAVDLSGWGLSDSAGRPRKWQFPSATR